MTYSVIENLANVETRQERKGWQIGKIMPIRSVHILRLKKGFNNNLKLNDSL